VRDGRAAYWWPSRISDGKAANGTGVNSSARQPRPPWRKREDFLANV
jgi:hypothetical protein